MNSTSREVRIKLKRIHPDAVLPTPATEYDVGYDVTSVEDIVIAPGRTALVHTGLCLADDPYIDTDDLRVFIKVEGRSGLALRGVWPVGGIIDPTYRGEMCVILYNSTNRPYEVSSGDRIAQFVTYVVPVVDPSVNVFAWTDDVGTSTRGDAGFGSSGS